MKKQLHILLPFLLTFTSLKSIENSLAIPLVAIGAGMLSFAAAGELAEARREDAGLLKKAGWSIAMAAPLLATPFIRTPPGQGSKEIMMLATCFELAALNFLWCSPTE
jgi:hypothetical protein